MRVYQFRHVGIVLLVTTGYYFTADHNNQQLVAGGAHEGTRTPTPEGTWT